MSVGKVMVGVGVLVVLVGVAIQLGMPLGRLPGDLKLTRGNFTLYSPLVTCLVLSVVGTVLLNLFLRR
ncbi:MAG TPA: DUF2905 domain-containing protein [Candidatus Dormibacteraeota bacterium]|nr:DUF2905 domain-containing protein [Candidatus Dormibacteraeota bacterium]